MRDSEAITCAIVTYNSDHVIEACLQALRAQLPERNIIIYDNNSQDQTVRRVEAVHPAIRIIRGRRNLGFGRAVNALRSAVQTPYLLLLNPDALIQPGAVEELLAVAESEPNAAVLGAVQLTPEGFYLDPQPSADRCREVGWIFGAAMLLRLDCFARHSPLFDPRFWMYYEDKDLCLSAAERGHRILLVNRALVLHQPGSSSVLPASAETLLIQRRQYLEFVISGYIFCFKHSGRLRTLAGACVSMIRSYVHYILLWLRGDPARYPAFQRSLGCALFYFRIFA
jgi:GT2 family glycosyltransferase